MKILKYLGQGLMHYENKLPCQDYIRTFIAENGNVILAVSDGCSSADFAVEGAKINTQAVINIFKNADICSPDITGRNLKDDIIDECIRLIYDDYSRKKETEPDKYPEDNLILSEYSATLLFAVINPDRSKAVIGHIGDGIIVGTDNGIGIHYISDAENIDDQSNMTYFTTSYNAKDHMRIDHIELDNIENIFLSSDGSYQMLWEYGFNADRNLEYHAGTTAAHIAHKICTGEIKTNSDFASLLDNICHYPLLRSDDWSIVIWNKSGESVSENEENEEPVPVIMMEIEEAKGAKEASETDEHSDEKPAENSDEKPAEISDEMPAENSDEKPAEDSGEEKNTEQFICRQKKKPMISFEKLVSIIGSIKISFRDINE